jgi:hypothetical protein
MPLSMAAKLNFEDAAMSDTTPYFTVRQTAARHRAFTEGSLRWLIFNRNSNGFDYCLVRIGRRLLIDDQRFIDWVAQHRERVSDASRDNAMRVRPHS